MRIKFIVSILLMLCYANTVLYGQSSADSTHVDRINKLDEVVVTGTRTETDIRLLPMTISVINREQIENSYEQSLLSILTEQVPGFFSTSRGVLGYGVSAGAAGGMSLRGVGGTPTAGLLVLIDGHPQYMGLMGHPIADAYQSMLAERVEVVRGPASVLYGSNAMGGAINIVTRKQQIDGMKNDVRVSYGSYNTLISEVSNRIRSGKFSSIITGSYNRTDGHRKNMEFEQYGGYAKLGYEFNRLWSSHVDINLTHFNASNPGSTAIPILDNDSHITRGMTSFSLENDYDKTSGAFKFFYNWGRHKINDGYQQGNEPLDYRFNSKDKMFGITWYQGVSLIEGNRITAGIDYQSFGGEAWNYFVSDGHNEELSDKAENEIAGYIDLRQKLGNILTFNAGLRFDHHSRTGSEWVPQVGLSAQLPRKISMKAVVSKGFRNPTIRELYMFKFANPDLDSERLWNYELSFSQSIIDNSLRYGLNLFYINGDNIIQTVMLDSRPLNINSGKIENWGIELNGVYRIDQNWNVSVNYSWLNMDNPVVASPEHKLYANINYTRHKWNISTGLQYINGLYTSISPDIKENFVLWNIQGSYQFCEKANLFIKGENLLAQKYEINAGYQMPTATITGGINLNF